MKRVLSAIVALSVVAVALRVRAETGVTNVVANGDVSNTTSLVIGNTGPFNALLVTNAGVVINTGNGTIGNGAAANSNIVLVADSGSLFSNSAAVVVGAAANRANQLNITNGAKVISAGGTIGNVASALNNSVIVSGGGSVWSNSGALNIAEGGASASGNRLTVSGGATNYSAGLRLGGFGNNYAFCNNNNVTITGPGTYWHNSGSQIFIEGGRSVTGSGTNNTVIITNGAVLNNNGAGLTFGEGVQSFSVNDALIVTGSGSVLTNAGIIVLGSAATDTGNRITISRGGVIYSGNQSGAAGGGAGGSGSGAVATVTDSGSLWNVSGQLIIGGGTAINGTLLVTNGGAMVNGQTIMGIGTGGGAINNTAIVTGIGSTWTSTLASANTTFQMGNQASGQTLKILNGGLLYVRNTGGGIGVGVGGNANIGNCYALVDGVGSLLDAAGNSIAVGLAGGVNNILVVTNGGQVLSAAVTIGGAGSYLNTAQVTGTGSTWESSSTFIMSGSNNLLQVADGGLLQTTGLTCPTFGSITNGGGIYQFTVASPTITPGTFGNIAINGGTVSFRGVTTASVLCNQSGGALDSATKMAWAGTNVFRLNTATNAAAGQAYTFTDTHGATNFARLELMNGAGYRGGAAAIGSGGSLAVWPGTSTMATDLTFQAGSSYEVTLNATNDYSHLVAQAGVTLGGTLLLNLGGTPSPDATYAVIDKTSVNPPTGIFGNGYLVVGSYQGTNYTFQIDYSSGAVLTLNGSPGTIIFLR